jgi:hypothetical protein
MRDYSHLAAVTPSDSALLATPCYGITVAVSGNVKISDYWANTQPTGGTGSPSQGSSQLPVGVTGPQIGPGPADGTPTVLYCLAGYVYPIRCSMIWATGTTATGIVALW